MVFGGSGGFSDSSKLSFVAGGGTLECIIEIGVFESPDDVHSDCRLLMLLVSLISVELTKLDENRALTKLSGD